MKKGNILSALSSPFSVFLWLIFVFLVGCSGSSGSSYSSATVSGTVRYEDREYSPNGFTGKTPYYKAVRYALIEVVDSSTGTVLASNATDSTGAYSITFNPLSSAAYVRVISATESQGAIAPPDVEVQNTSGGSLYAVAGASFALGNQVTSDIDIPISSQAGAFNIMDVFTSGGEFIKGLSGTDPPAIKAYWSAGSADGTYYCTSINILFCSKGEGIYVLGGSWGDTDEYDDDVLMHEYGHFAADVLSRDDSLGGEHRLTDNDLDLRLSWSEGWGGFFPGALKAWLNDTNPALLSTYPPTMPLSQYVDTADASYIISIDIADPGLCPNGKDCYVYSSSEIAVASVLYKTMEGYGMQDVWDVFAGYLPSATPVNLEAFWDGWLSLYAADITDIFSERSIYYKEDLYEDDGDVLSSKPYAVDEHYLYRDDGTPDIDIVAFDALIANTYTIETYCLKNGADTYLRLFDTDGVTELVADDDTYNSYGCGPDNFSQYSSQIIYNTVTPGTYFIEVSTSQDVPLSAGRYGTYSLKITNTAQ